MCACACVCVFLPDAPPISKTPPLPSQPGRTVGRSSPRRSPTLCLQLPPLRRWSGWHTFRSASMTYWQRVSETLHGRTASRSVCVGGISLLTCGCHLLTLYAHTTHTHTHTHTQLTSSPPQNTPLCGCLTVTPLSACTVARPSSPLSTEE